MKNTCYICDNVATTDEHVPPKCFFPKNLNLRKELITVRACKKHNNEKSIDDEFFRTIILLNPQNNHHGKKLYFGKTLRAVKRSSLIYKGFIKSQKKQFHSDERVAQFDRVRFDRCVEYMVKALFYDMYKFKWDAPLVINSPSFGMLSKHENYYLPLKEMKVVELCMSFLQSEQVLGENLEIFKYRIRYDDKEKVLCFGAQFYDSFELFVYSKDN